MQTISFNEFIFKEKRNRVILLILAAIMTLEFLILKYFYPQAGFISDDSYVYLHSATYNVDIDFYLVGYAKFLRLFSVFSNSDLSLTAFQYLFIQSSTFFLLFTIFYFRRPTRTVELILLSLTALNPLPLYLSNYVSSDGLFFAISFIWFALLLWLIFKPSIKIAILHAIVIFIAFTFRYNALIYPLISIYVLIFHVKPLQSKIIGIVLTIILCGLFVLHTGNSYKKVTGKWQYSAFSGWQLANNAMYAYRYVDADKRIPAPPSLRSLDQSVRIYFDSTRDWTRHIKEAVTAGTFYMWDRDLPLFKYRETLFKTDTTESSDFRNWASMGPIYTDYGLFLIEHYPWEFTKYFLLPNAAKYFAPPVEYLGFYNSGKEKIAVIAQTWFGYKSQQLKVQTPNLIVHTLDFYQILTGIINLVFVGGLICLILINGFKKDTVFRKCVITASVLWIMNALFTISASSVALRFQSFPILLTFMFDILIVDWIMKSEMEPMGKQSIPNIHSEASINGQSVV